MCGKMKRARLSSQVRKTFRGSTRGFTLIEVVIAIAILGTIAVTFLGALSTSSLALITADQRATAESLARSQMEYVKNQGYNSTLVGGQVTYDEIPGIPDGYTICSYNRTGGVVESVIGIPWDSNSTQPLPVGQDNGIQKIALVIKYQDKEIYTFINDNPNWANGVKITLEGYKRQPVM
jgi:prepilin-type N-terminal cleavage/methylation domain-containing protein